MIYWILSNYIIIIHAFPIDDEYSGDYDIINTTIEPQEKTYNEIDTLLLFLIIFSVPIIYCLLVIILYVRYSIIIMISCLREIYNDYKLGKYQRKLNNPKTIIKNSFTKYIKNKTETPFGDICTICCEDKKTNRILLPCKHIYHTKCITDWVQTEVNDSKNPTCPTCRKIIYDNTDFFKIKNQYVENQIYNYNSNSDSDNSYDEY